MAESPALKKLSEQLTCPVCLEHYEDPKVLNCHHVFCSHCLEGLARREGTNITCPTCRHETPIPVGNLKSAFHIHSLIDIQETLLEQQAPSKGTASDASQEFTGDHCPTHPDRLLEMFCDTCDRPICCACIVNDHKSHSFSLITDITQEQKRTLSLQSKLLEQQLQVTQSQLENISIDIKKVKQHHTGVQETIQSIFEGLRKLLDARKRELTDDLEDQTQQTLESLLARKSSLETVEVEAKHILDFSTAAESIADIITAKKQVADVLQRTTTNKFSSDRSELSFFYRQSDFDKLLTVGELYYQTPCARKSFLRVVNNVASVELGGTVLLVLVVRDQRDSNLTSSIKNLECTVVPCGLTNTTPAVSVIVKYSEIACHYDISCTPAVRGRHQLNVTIDGELVIGSPCQIVVWPAPAEYGVPVHYVNNIKAPWGIAINSEDQVVVTEIKNHRLLFFDREANKIMHTVGRNILSDVFQQPSDVFVDCNDQLYVIEQQTFVIKKCDKDGNVLKSVGCPGDTSLRFNSPFGMCIHPQNGRLYVADMQNNRIQVLNSDLTFHSFILSSRDNKRAIRLPTDITFDASGTMFVTDNENHCLCVY